MFENYLLKMTSLTKLIIDWSSNNLDYNNVDDIVNMIGYFDELKEVELNLQDNYIDNYGFEEILNSFGENCDIVLNVTGNNIV